MEVIPESLIKGSPDPVDLEKTEKIVEQMKKSVFKNCVEGKRGTGFFCGTGEKIIIIIKVYY